MHVFISWSGPLSQGTAEALRRFLPCMLQGLEVFLSRHDIQSGARWSIQLAEHLERTSFGIVCLTPTNQDSAWLLYEAGALTKHVEGRACGLLLGDLTAANVTGPLAQFQHRRMDHDEVFHLVRDLNRAMERPLDDGQLSLVFEKWWPDLDLEYNKRLAATPPPPLGQPQGKRPERDLIEEILERVRGMERSNSGGDARLAIQAAKKLVECLPQDERTVFLELLAAKRQSDDAAVHELAARSSDVVDVLIGKGFVWHDHEGVPRVSRLFSRLAYSAIKE